MKIRSRLVLLVAGAFPALSSFASGQAPASPADEPQPAGQRIRVDLGVDPVDHGAFLDHLAELRLTRKHEAFRHALASYRAALHQNAGELYELVAELGGSVVEDRWLTPALIVENASPDLVNRLGSRARVDVEGPARYRGPNGLAEALDAFHHDAAGANALSVGGVPVEGAGVTIAILDSGIELSIPGASRPHRTFYQDANPNLASGGIGGSRIQTAEGLNLSTGQSFGDGDDDNGHGTRVASFAAGAAFPSSVPGVGDGVAPSASLRAIEMTGNALSGIAPLGAMVTAVELAASYPDVLVANMSYDGTPFACGEPSPTIDAAVRSGIVVTVSGGQNGTGSIMHGTYNAIPVGASFLDSKAPYAAGPFSTSAIGPLPDGRRYPLLIAVGEELTGATLDDELGAVNSYGTSGSAAITGGTAVLMRQVAPWLSALEIKAILLNTADLSSVSGNPDATGLGYLQTKVAVESALASEVTTRLAQGLERSEWDLGLSAGEELVVTAVWERQNTLAEDPGNCFVSFADIPKPVIADVDLVLRDGFGNVVAQSRSAFDNVEAIRFQAPANGGYTLEVEVMANEQGTGLVEIALGGLKGFPTRVIAGPCDSQVAGISFADADPVDLSLLAKPSRTVVKGCGLSTTVAASIGGLPAAFEIYSLKVVEIEIPYGLAPGSQLLTLTQADGTVYSAALQLEPAAPFLTAPYDVAPPIFPLGQGIPGTVRLTREPGDPFGIVFSPVFGDTSLPGIVDLNIGGGALTSLLTVATGLLDASGSGTFEVGGPALFGVPVGTKLYFQGVVFDLTLLGLVPSNVGTTLIRFPA